MTEFEIATLAFQKSTLAFQEATLGFQEATLAVRRTGLWIAGAHVAATVVIGLGQIAVVAWGIRAMQRAGDHRAAEQDQRHAEAMQALDLQRRALETLIAGQREQGEALREQGAALREEGAALREQGAALREQGAALSALVARTAPAGG